MKRRSLSRVFLAFFLSVLMVVPFVLAVPSASAQTSNGFVWDATRLCGESLGLRWDASNVEKIEFSVTDTSLNWTTGWIEATDFDSQYHYEPVGQRFDKVNVRVTFEDGTTFEDSANIGACDYQISSPWPSLDTTAPDGGEVVTPGGGGPTPEDGAYSDPESGNSFEFLTAHRMCEDNSLLVTWTGQNLISLRFAVYNPSPGWGTDWIETDIASSVFTLEVERDGPYFVDAAVYFENTHIVSVTVSVPDCTPAAEVGNEIPDAGIGENSLRVQITMPDGADISGAPFDLFAPQAAAQASITPYISGFVGANNTVAIDGLIPGQYRLAVYLGSDSTIEALITVGDQPVTTAMVTVNENGTTTVAYAAQEDEDPPPTGTEPTTGSSGSGVSGLPSTGIGSSNAGLLVLASAAVMMVAGAAAITRLGISRR